MQQLKAGPSGSVGTMLKTGILQHTPNYTWNTADALGKGATAVVYFGRNKVRKMFIRTLKTY